MLLLKLKNRWKADFLLHLIYRTQNAQLHKGPDPKRVLISKLLGAQKVRQQWQKYKISRLRQVKSTVKKHTGPGTERKLGARTKWTHNKGKDWLRYKTGVETMGRRCKKSGVWKVMMNGTQEILLLAGLVIHTVGQDTSLPCLRLAATTGPQLTNHWGSGVTSGKGPYLNFIHFIYPMKRHRNENPHGVQKEAEHGGLFTPSACTW